MNGSVTRAASGEALSVADSASNVLILEASHARAAETDLSADLGRRNLLLKEGNNLRNVGGNERLALGGEGAKDGASLGVITMISQSAQSKKRFKIATLSRVLMISCSVLFWARSDSAWVTTQVQMSHSAEPMLRRALTLRLPWTGARAKAEAMRAKTTRAIRTRMAGGGAN